MLKTLFICLLTCICCFSFNTLAADVDKRAQRIIKRLDTNQDGIVTREEAKQIRVNRFQKIDGNADGQLTLAEFSAEALEQYNAKRTQQFNFHDKDQDGLITFAETKQKLGLFKRFDQNNDDIVSVQEMRAKNMSEKRLQHLTMKVDSNHDQQITREEMAQFRWKNILKYDGNQDNQVTLKEWSQPSAKMEKKQERLQKRFVRLDKNNDGVVSLEEFSQYQPRFDWADKNRDDKLTLDEVKTVLQKREEKQGNK